MGCRDFWTLLRFKIISDSEYRRNSTFSCRFRYIPIVLSGQEIEAVLKHLEHPYSLVVKLLYGCGLRLFECVKVRAKDFNFDAGILTAHGKGGKDCTVPIPQTIMPELTAQFDAMPIPFATLSSRISYRPITISARSRRFWATAMLELQ